MFYLTSLPIFIIAIPSFDVGSRERIFFLLCLCLFIPCLCFPLTIKTVVGFLIWNGEAPKVLVGSLEQSAQNLRGCKKLKVRGNDAEVRKRAVPPCLFCYLQREKKHRPDKSTLLNTYIEWSYINEMYVFKGVITDLC